MSSERECSLMDSRPPFLRLHDVVVRRAGKSILTIDSFELPEGESIALLGPNGSGKTTFVNLVTREVFPLYRDKPPVLFRGKDRPMLAEVKSVLGVVSATMQDQIRVHLPVVEVVMGGLFGTLGLPLFYEFQQADYDCAMNALEELGIDDLSKRDIMTLSTGQARRVIIARALINNPDWFIFDEPCTGLDPEGMFYVRSSMRQLAQHGHAIMLVTHYPEDIIPEIGRILLLKEGSIFDDGSKEAILTDERMTALFDVPLHMAEDDGYYALVGRY